MSKITQHFSFSICNRHFSDNYERFVSSLKMAKRRAKKTVKRTESVPETNEIGTEEPKEPQIQTQEAQLIDLELEGLFFPLLALCSFLSSLGTQLGIKAQESIDIVQNICIILLLYNSEAL